MRVGNSLCFNVCVAACGRARVALAVDHPPVDPPRSFTTTKNNVIVNGTAFVNVPDSLGKHSYHFGLGETLTYVFQFPRNLNQSDIKRKYLNICITFQRNGNSLHKIKQVV